MHRITLNVYFSATGTRLHDGWTNDNSLILKDMYYCDPSTILTQHHIQNLSEAKSNGSVTTSYKIGFDGCGLTHGIVLGGAFGVGLKSQAQIVIDFVKHLIRAGKAVYLHTYGMSRGAVACMYLNEQLKHIPKKLLIQRALYFDPVPGNLIATQKLDVANLSWANQVKKLHFRNADHVLLLVARSSFKYMPFHQPIVPEMAVKYQLETIPGRHMEALGGIHFVMNEKYDPRYQYASLFTIVRMLNFISSYNPSHYLHIISQYYNLFEIEYKILRRQVARHQYDPIIPSKAPTLHSSTYKLATTFSNTSLALNQWHQRLREKTNCYPKSAQRKLKPCQGAKDECKPVLNMSNSTSNGKRQVSTAFTQLHVKNMSSTAENIKPLQILNKIRQFCDIIIMGLETTHPKVTHLQKIRRQLNDSKKNISLYECHTLLKRILLVTLQRRLFSYSLFTTTRTGWQCLHQLNQKGFSELRHLVCKRNKLIYKDLQQFCISSDKFSYFNSKYQHRNFSCALNDLKNNSHNITQSIFQRQISQRTHLAI